ncbi:DNA polymerase ligase N-terminal domain-containing protein [Planctomycetota bacterium]
MADDNRKFVIQEHRSGADVHWDLMLEQTDVLETYRLDKGPGQLLAETANAEKIFDHPKKFLTYQGPVNKGAGRVEIVEAGTYKITNNQNGQLELSLDGRILKGDFTLTLVEGERWLLFS